MLLIKKMKEKEKKIPKIRMDWKWNGFYVQCYLWLKIYTLVWYISPCQLIGRNTTNKYWELSNSTINTYTHSHTRKKNKRNNLIELNHNLNKPHVRWQKPLNKPAIDQSEMWLIVVSFSTLFYSIFNVDTIHWEAFSKTSFLI